MKRGFQPASKSPTKQYNPLPDAMLSDLTDAFNFYDKESKGEISMMNFRNILHNFGCMKNSKKEIDDELRACGVDPIRAVTVDFDAVKQVVNSRWNNGGKDEEAQDSFRVFDKKDKGAITSADLKSILSLYLEFPVSEAEINEFIEEGDISKNGTVNFKEFAELYGGCNSFLNIVNSSS